MLRRPLTRIELTKEDKAELEEVRKLAAEAAGIAGKAQATAAPVKASTAQRIGFSGAKRASVRRPGLAKDQLELVRLTDAQGRERVEIAPVAEQLSFDKGFFLAFRAVQLLRDATPVGGLVFVALAGPSGAGKTVFAEKLLKLLPGSALLTLDMYNDGSRVINGNYDDERLTDYATLLANLECLRRGEPCEAPIYDFKLSRRTGFRTVAPPTSRVVILEGIYALSSTLRPVVDLRIAVKGGVHLDLLKRVLRDVTRSAQTPEDIIQQISETVYPMYKAFIEPDLQTAHLSIQNSFNPFSGFAHPTYVLKAPAGPEMTEAAIQAALGPGCVRKADPEGTTDIYLLPPHEHPATCATWLRMRNRDGRWLLVFEEFMTDGPFIISPNVRFEVNVKILGGLMALGYEIGVTLRRSTIELTTPDELVTVKLDLIGSQLETPHPPSEGLFGAGSSPGDGGSSSSDDSVARAPTPPARYVQVQGRLRAAVEEAARKLGIHEDDCVPHSYIQQVQAGTLGGATLHPALAAAADSPRRNGGVTGLASPRFGSFAPMGEAGEGEGAAPAEGGGLSSPRMRSSQFPPQPPPAMWLRRASEGSGPMRRNSSSESLRTAFAVAPSTPHASAPAPASSPPSPGEPAALAALAARLDSLSESVAALAAAIPQPAAGGASPSAPPPPPTNASDVGLLLYSQAAQQQMAFQMAMQMQQAAGAGGRREGGGLEPRLLVAAAAASLVGVALARWLA